MRGKEEAHDYRYFPEPDLMPVEVSDKWKNKLSNSLPELPDKRFERFIRDYNLPEYDVDIITDTREMADYYEEIVKETTDFKAASNWLMGEILFYLKENKITIKEFPIDAKFIGELIELINSDVISGKIAKEIFPEMINSGKSPKTIVQEKNLIQITDNSELEMIIENILEVHPKQVKEFKNGKEKVLGFLVGKVMRDTRGKANPRLVNELMKKKLNNY
jgi:aspartyl-tRNA(Asn)/glutamyl-tRNA(Gln) amidotransferase subunit B